MKRKMEPGQRSVSGKVLSVLSSLALAVTGIGLTAPARAAEPVINDGQTQATAAASCWEAKQLRPTSASGRYWLMTPAMAAPEQFYCDQETDGGGWVLVGRGREGWKENYEGRGTTAQVSASVTGTPAFSPRQLSSVTIDGLLNGESAQSTPDGIRLTRALNTAGTQWQEVRFQTQKRERWTWTFSSATPTAAFKFDGVSGSGGTTASFGSGQGNNRVVTSEAQNQSWTQGWAYGSSIAGTTATDSYLWSATAGVGNARPFTQMYLRPKLLQSNVQFGTIPNAGTAKYEQRSMQQTGAMPTVWGVNGLASGSGELRTESQSFAQIGDTVFVGGNFQYVQKTSAGGSRVQQSYVAGFNVNTGEFVTGFRPTLNGQVKELVALPNGLLVVGGEFTTANGQPAVGVVALNPATGNTSTAWNLKLENRISGGSVSVRAMAVRGNWLYLGGAFTHLTGSSNANAVYARSAGRVSVTNGTPDATWNPAFNGTVLDVAPSQDGARLYASGYFTASNSTPTDAAAAIRTTANAQVDPWAWTPSASAHFQFGVADEGGRVWLGGSEHSLFSFNPSTFQRLSSNITRAGGDFQDVTGANGLIYAGCHCGHWNYTNGTVWPGPGPSWTAADKINLVGIWDAKTGAYLPEFNPVIKGRGGYGIWGNFVDSTGVLWTGGDLVSSVRSNGASQWSGGFARFALNDSTAPGVPGSVKVTSDGTTDTVTWNAATGTPSTYHVLRNDRVVGTTTTVRELKLPHQVGAKYFVRAADAAGNYSGSSAVATAATVPPPAQVAKLIENGQPWKYNFANSAPAAAWTTTAFNDDTWASGSAPLGWGNASVVTTLSAAGTKPLAYQARKAFTVADASKIENLTVTTRADDGIVAYLNGVEIVRANMGTGTIAYNSYATAAPSTAAALATPVTATIPGWAVHDGVNVISVEVHSNYRSTPNSTFDLDLTAELGTQPPAPEDPGPVAGPAEAIANGSIWKYLFANEAPVAGWTQPATSDSTWKEGKAPLGWGSSSIATVLTVAGTKPLSSYYRKSFVIEDPSLVHELKLTTRADDGIAVYVNGVEVARKNLPQTALAFNSYALTSPSTSAALNDPLGITVPGSALVSGRNVIAAEVHSNYRSTPNVSFELEALIVETDAAQNRLLKGLEKLDQV